MSLCSSSAPTFLPLFPQLSFLSWTQKFLGPWKSKCVVLKYSFHTQLPWAPSNSLPNPSNCSVYISLLNLVLALLIYMSKVHFKLPKVLGDTSFRIRYDVPTPPYGRTRHQVNQLREPNKWPAIDAPKTQEEQREILSPQKRGFCSYYC